MAIHIAAMKHQKYSVTISDDHLSYFFYSVGPKGNILKGIVYSPIDGSLFNLGFGDWSKEAEEFDDSSRTNNGDRDKVLATVAFSAIDFTNAYPNATIFVKGNNSARTRLYQMQIMNNLPEIKATFDVQGFIDGDWESFRKDRLYESFLAKRN